MNGRCAEYRKVLMPERSTIILDLLLIAILTILSYLQAVALRGIKRVMEDFVAIQIREHRNRLAKELDALNPLVWF